MSDDKTDMIIGELKARVKYLEDALDKALYEALPLAAGFKGDYTEPFNQGRQIGELIGRARAKFSEGYIAGYETAIYDLQDNLETVKADHSE